MRTDDGIRLLVLKCRNCLGCNQLEIETFRGDIKCINHKDALMVERKGLSSCYINKAGHTKDLQKNSTVRRER